MAIHKFLADPCLPDSIRVAIDELARAYDLLEQIHEGGNGCVFRAVNRLLGTQTIIKFYGWEGDVRYHLEPQALTTINSPNVVNVFDARVVDKSWALFITPYCSDGSLDRLLSGTEVGVLQAVDICTGILSGVAHLHALKFVHRDIKPGNIYLRDGQAVIGDFGSLVILPEGETTVPASRHSVLYRPRNLLQMILMGFLEIFIRLVSSCISFLVAIFHTMKLIGSLSGNVPSMTERRTQITRSSRMIA